MRPIYRSASISVPAVNGHRGLWFDRFFDRYSADWTLDETAKLVWINTVTGLTGDGPAIEAAAGRARVLCQALGGQTHAYVAPWHFATGLGNPHPVENGFCWHPTLGSPYIAGAAVKGLVRAWIEAWADFDAEDSRRAATLHRWFGSDHKDPAAQATASQAGNFIFFDALPNARFTLKADVMTPHMGKWYAKGGDISNVFTEHDRVPADWHDPVPVPFLVADKPSFQFCIAPRNTGAAHELTQVFEALEEALGILGAGAKTAAGYGRLEPDRDENQRLEAARRREDLERLPVAERLRNEITDLTERQLAEKLGKDRNKTRIQYGENWDAFLDMVAQKHGALLQSWRAENDRNRKRAYKTVFERNAEQ